MSSYAFRKTAPVIVIAALGLFGPAPGSAETATTRPFTMSKLQEVELGELAPGKWDMKATMLVVEPAGEIPAHTHKGPGLRYVLEGAITITWSDGRHETFKAGSTYFEGTGVNHPAGNISAKNEGAVPCRVLIVELVPK